MKSLCLIAFVAVLAAPLGAENVKSVSEAERIKEMVTIALRFAQLSLLNRNNVGLPDITSQQIRNFYFQGLFGASKQNIQGLADVTTKFETVPNSDKVNILIQFPALVYNFDFTVNGNRLQNMRNGPLTGSGKASIQIDYFTISMKNLLFGETLKNGKKIVQIKSVDLDLDYGDVRSYVNGVQIGHLSKEDSNGFIELDIYTHIRDVTKDAGEEQKQKIVNNMNQALEDTTEWLEKHVGQVLSWVF